MKSRPHAREKRDGPRLAEIPVRVNETICGYTIVRRLQTGHSSHIYLARQVNNTRNGATNAGNDFCVKVPHVSESETRRENAVLSAVRSPFVVSLRDVGTNRHGRAALVFPLLSALSLDDVLAEQKTISLAEAVTLVASVLQGLRDVYRAGFLHGSFEPNCVLFDAARTPILIGLGHAVAHEHATEKQRAVELDGVLAFMTRVFERACGGSHYDGLGRLRAVRDEDLRGYRGKETLERWLEVVLSFHEPQPLSEAFPAASAVDSGQGLNEPVVSGADVQHQFHHRAFARRAVDWIVNKFVRRLSVVFSSRRLWQAQRRRLIFGGVLAVTLTAVVLAAVPSVTPEGVTNETSSPTPSPSETPESSEDLQAGDARSLDDPLAATVLLLAMRHQCFDDLSLLCLEDVDQASSPLLAADRDTIGGKQPSTAIIPPSDVSQLSLRERNGDAALVTFTPPRGTEQPVLVVRGVSGWRLREIFAPARA